MSSRIFDLAEDEPETVISQRAPEEPIAPEISQPETPAAPVSNLVACPDCGRAISRHSEVCIGCGRFIQSFVRHHKLIIDRRGWSLTFAWGLILGWLLPVLALWALVVIFWVVLIFFGLGLSSLPSRPSYQPPPTASPVHP